MRRADIEVPNRSVDMDSWDLSACYPRCTFYPLSDGPSTWDRRITRPCFRTCSTCRSRSQAPLCPCTRQPIADRLEGTFGRLRYSLGNSVSPAACSAFPGSYVDPRPPRDDPPPTTAHRSAAHRAGAGCSDESRSHVRGTIAAWPPRQAETLECSSTSLDMH